MGIEQRKAKICPGLARGECDGFSEIDDSFSKFTALGVNLRELNIDQRISRIEALSFTKSSLGGAEFASGQGLYTTRVSSVEWGRGLRRCLAERQPQS